MPDQWTHLAATYDGWTFSLFIDGVKVKADQGQRGALFSDITRQCKVVFLGGHPKKPKTFRGFVSGVQIWSRALNHSDILQLRGFNVDTQPDSTQDVAISGPLNDRSLWEPVNPTKSVSQWRPFDLDKGHQVNLNVPQCGQTVCDDPTVVKWYTESWKLRLPKTIRYRIVRIANDDGSDPAITNQQISAQDAALRRAYKPYNISWQLEVITIRNSSLRGKTVLLGCPLSSIGNGQCNSECQHALTGNDGGDCDEFLRPCASEEMGNGICDMQCNVEYYGWDGGDCCSAESSNTSNTCRDPKSSLR